MSRPISAANEALGFVWRQVAIQVSGLTVLLVGIALGAQWGLTAASFGVLVASTFGVFLNCRMLVRFTPVTAQDIWRAAWPSWVTAAILGVVVAAAHFALERGGVTRPGLQFTGDVVVASITYPILLIWTPFRSVAKVVRESVDDLVPWVARAFPFGSLRPVEKETA
jgi:hypothetical protein